MLHDWGVQLGCRLPPMVGSESIVDAVESPSGAPQQRQRGASSLDCPADVRQQQRGLSVVSGPEVAAKPSPSCALARDHTFSLEIGAGVESLLLYRHSFAGTMPESGRDACQETGAEKAPRREGRLRSRRQHAAPGKAAEGPEAATDVAHQLKALHCRAPRRRRPTVVVTEPTDGRRGRADRYSRILLKDTADRASSPPTIAPGPPLSPEPPASPPNSGEVDEARTGHFLPRGAPPPTTNTAGRRVAQRYRRRAHEVRQRDGDGAVRGLTTTTTTCPVPSTTAGGGGRGRRNELPPLRLGHATSMSEPPPDSAQRRLRPHPRPQQQPPPAAGATELEKAKVAARERLKLLGSKFC